MAPEAAAALPSLPNQPITPIPAPAATDPQLVELGRLLFNSPDLSGNGARSCASCHDVATNGASPHRFDWAPDGRPLTINTPTVFNAALSWRLGWRGQDRTVRAQADDSLHDPTLMDADPATVVARLHRSTALQGPFRLAGRTPCWSAVLDALAAYETTLLTPDSPFDRWLKGDHAALTPRQVSGYETFKSIGCASCHQGVNVGGNLFEHQGVVNPAGTPSRALFRVPSLRNVALTAPYFHDGSAATLHDAVRRMANAQLGRDLDDGMIDNIAAFLTALTGAHPAPPPAARP
jgi:cytochrome c peroxidase